MSRKRMRRGRIEEEENEEGYTEKEVGEEEKGKI